MVKIINGEIVRDDDPRLKQRANSAAAPSSQGARPGVGRSNIKDVFSKEDSNSDTNSRSRSERSHEPSKKSRKDQSNPLDAIAKGLGIQDRIITIPAVSAIQISESKVGLIYCLVAILGIVMFGTKAALIVVVFYVLWKKSNVNNTEL